MSSSSISWKTSADFFARSWCAKIFADRGLEQQFTQCNISYSAVPGTLRGLHFQKAPDSETKLVRCTAGSVYDVMVDIRRGSPTFGKWWAGELSARNRKAHYIPTGFAHGFQTLARDSELFYQMSRPHCAESAHGLCWDDPQLAITWPQVAHRIISEKDRSLPRLCDL